VISYPLAIINVFVAAALIYLYIRPTQTITAPYNPDPEAPAEAPITRTWNPPIRASIYVAIFFLLSNIFLVIAPFVPPTDGQNVYESLPYYLHCVVGIGMCIQWPSWDRKS
jgi:hypothetical protein